jgi:acetylornithine deacetylase/succinyl-diaminopimelate desuccinylase-like protein
MDQPVIDWDAITREATDLLCHYIRINTTNPPGGEEAAARWLAELIRAEGIDDITFYDASDADSPGRLNMRACLPGDGSKRPLILLNHTDVVPVERDGWEEDPFSGVVKDGIIWGRGAIDMKGMGIIELIALLLMKRHAIPHARDIVFYAVADEEAGSAYGVEFLAKHHPESLDAEYVLNEGGWGSTELLSVRRPVFNCAVSEKGPCWLRLSTQGRPGHGSVPHSDNALARLVAALHRIAEWQRPREVVPELSEYFALAHKHGFMRDEPSEQAIVALAERNPLINAITMNTISMTTARAGVKHNVIPASAEATIDCRLLPGTDSKAFIDEVQRVIDDPKVSVEPVLDSNTPASPIDTELMSTIHQVTREFVEDAVVLPSVSAGFTDSRVFRRMGITAYGFIPVLLEPAEAITVHGHNERLGIENLRLGCQMMFEVVRRVSA